MESRGRKVRDLVLGFLGKHPQPTEEHTGAFLAEHADLADKLKLVLAEVRDLPASERTARVEELTAPGSPTMMEDFDPELTVPEGGAAGGATAAEAAAGDFDRTLDESGLGEATIAEPAEADATMPAPEGGDAALFAGRYRFLRRLGAGGFGRVDLVEDTWRKNEKVALKVLLPQHQDKDEFGSRFQNEISVLRALRHPGISQIYNDGRTESGEYYYTMEYVDGASMEDVLDVEGNLGPQRIVRLVRQMIDILDYAHSEGVVHRDLKPANILIVNEGSEDEQVKILDFGIAKIMRREGILEFAQTMETMAAMGTPHYMAPEQVRGRDVDPRADLYALGVIIYRMVSHRYPFKGDTAMEVATARIDQDPAPLEVDAAPSQLTTLVKQLLSRERDDRPSYADIVSLLEQVAEGQRDYRRLVGQILRVAVAAIVVLAIFLVKPWTWFEGGAESPQAAAPRRTTSGPEAAARLDDTRLREVAPEDAQLFLVSASGESISIGGAGGDDLQASVDALEVPEGDYRVVARREGSADLELDRYVVDRTPPVLDCDWGALGEPIVEDGVATFYYADARATLAGTVTDAGLGGAVVRVGNETVEPDLDGNFRYLIFDGVDESHRVRSLAVTAVDRGGNETEPRELTFVYDGEAPSLAYRAPGAGSVAGPNATIEVAEGTDRIDVSVADRYPGELLVDGEGVEAEGDGRYSIAIAPEPSQSFELEAIDRSGNRTTGSLTVELRTAIERLSLGEVDLLTATGPVEADASDLVLTARLNRDDREPSLFLGGEPLTLEARSDGSWLATGAMEAGARDLEVRVGAAVLGVFPIRRTPPRAPRGFTVAGEERTGAWARTIEHDESGMTFVCVPPPSSGYVYRGESAGTSVQVSVDLERPFYVSATEVTWEQFAASGLDVDRVPSFRDGVGDDHPVVGVDFETAVAFTEWVGRSLEAGEARLPTRAEWLHAAGGDAAPVYPWGDAWNPESCHSRAANVDATVSVLAIDAPSWCGANGFAGNAAEWCTADGEPIVLGGSWSSSSDQCRLTSESPVFGTGGKNTVGFRVVVELEEE